MTVTFVIPTLNEARYLESCVRSIQQLTRPSHGLDIEVVVVDTGSTDQTLAIAHGVGARVVQLRGATVGRARNVGAQEARGDVLAFVDADCELPAEWLLLGLEHLRRSGVAAMGTSLVAPPTTATWVERHWHQVIYAARRRPYEDVRWLPASNLLIWSRSFHAVHGFNETLISCEDCDLGYRLAVAETLVLEHRAGTRHLRESRTLGEFFTREWRRGLGNFHSWHLHRWDRRESWGVVGPFAFVGLPLAIILTALTAPAHKSLLLALEALTMGIVPYLMLLKRGVRLRMGGASFVCCYALACIYLTARGSALLNNRKATGPGIATQTECPSRT
jgi:glycosyltransferase involved in cell wall biosynthesis